MRLERLEPHLGLIILSPRSDVLAARPVLEAGDYLGASLYAPFGASRYFDWRTLESGQYIRALLEKPDIAKRLDPPMVMVGMDDTEIRIVNDGVGFGRLYEFNVDGLKVWSNQPAAGYFLAGVPPERDLHGWGMFAALGWFCGNRTPFAHVRRLDGDTHIVARAHGTRTHRLPDFMEQVPDHIAGGERHLDETADSLVRKFREICSFRTSQQPLHQGLSGGRDSRVVVAAALGAGIDLTLRTAFPPMKELEIAEELVRRCTVPLIWSKVDKREQSLTLAGQSDPQPIAEAMSRAFLVAGGDSMTAALYKAQGDTHLSTFANFSLSGGGGEFGHASGYAFADLTGSVDKRLRAIGSTFLRLPYVREFGKKALTAHYDEVADLGRRRGLKGLHLLDHWYVHTRFRRWGGGNLAFDVVMPLTAERFLINAFTQSPQQKLTADLHRKLVQRLRPEWDGVPFMFEVVDDLPARERSNAGSVPFVWETARWAEVRDLLHSTDAYDDVFDREEVLKAFDEPEKIPPQKQIRARVILDRILWRIGFESHLERLAKAVTAS